MSLTEAGVDKGSGGPPREGPELPTREVGGLAIVSRYGDPAEEYRAARRGVALEPRPWRMPVRIAGDDRAGYLQGMISNDIEGLSPGEGCCSLLLTRKGKVVAVLELWAGEDELWMACDRRAVYDVVERLEKYKVRAEVEFEPREDGEVVLGVVGPDADELVRGVGLELPADGPRSWCPSEIDGATVRVHRTPALGVPGVELYLPGDAVETLRSRLDEAAGGEIMQVGWDIAEVLRVEAGLPGQGAEIDGSSFPQEARLDDAIDYEKGCYLGQETVARIHYRGQVNRLLAGLRLERAVATEAVVRAGDDEAGSVTTAVESPALGALALGYLQREHTEPGTELTAGDGVAATVVELPFSREPPFSRD